MFPDEHGYAALFPGTYVVIDKQTHVACIQSHRLSLFRKFTKGFCLDCYNRRYNMKALTLDRADYPDKRYGYRIGEKWSTYGTVSDSLEEAEKARSASNAKAILTSAFSSDRCR